MEILEIHRADSTELLAFMETESHGQIFRQVWTASKVRKNVSCAYCSKEIKVGQYAFRPMTNLDNRSARICTSHIYKNKAKAALRGVTGKEK